MLIPNSIKRSGHRLMMFVDGENVAARFEDELRGNTKPVHVEFEQSVYAWSGALTQVMNRYETIRKYYFTSVQGDTDKISVVEEKLKSLEFEAPRVFKRTKGRSKRVDIALTTEMLLHASRDNFDAAVLVTGDEDYVPVVEAVASMGKRVVLWAFASGRSSKLAHACDFAANISHVMLGDHIRANNLVNW